MPDKYDGKKRGQAAENWILDLEAYFVMKRLDYPTARDEIGFAMAKLFAQEGARLTIASRTAASQRAKLEPLLQPYQTDGAEPVNGKSPLGHRFVSVDLARRARSAVEAEGRSSEEVGEHVKVETPRIP